LGHGGFGQVAAVGDLPSVTATTRSRYAVRLAAAITDPWQAFQTMFGRVFQPMLLGVASAHDEELMIKFASLVLAFVLVGCALT
jgi:hypothetical protein